MAIESRIITILTINIWLMIVIIQDGYWYWMLVTAYGSDVGQLNVVDE